MNEIENVELIRETRELVKGMRADMAKVARNLYYLYSHPETWEGRHDSWGDFLEKEIGLDQGFASRLRTNYEHYVIEGGLSDKQIQGVDHLS